MSEFHTIPFDFTPEQICEAFEAGGGDLLELGFGVDGHSYQVINEDLINDSGFKTGWVISRDGQMIRDDAGRVYVYDRPADAARDAANLMNGRDALHLGAEVFDA